MIKGLVLLLAITATICSELRGVANDDLLFKEFNQFLLKYNKSYSSKEEFNARFQIFKNNFVRLNTYKGTRKSTHKVGITKFFDMTPQEFRRQYTNLKLSVLELVRSKATLIRVEKKALADSVDWRSQGAVVNVKDQGQCGSCWAFSTVANIESQNFIKHGNLIALSEQQLVDCDDNGDQGCNGGLMENAFEYLTNNGGIMLQKDYPYTARNGKCKFSKAKVAVTLNGFNKLDSTDEDEIATFLASNGPLSIAVNADPLQYYDSGVIDVDESECDPQGLDHGVTLVGYGVSGSQKFWIVRNSWGTNWGEKGYFRIVRGTGACGINTDVSTAIIN